MSRRRVLAPPDPIPASLLCQVVTGDNGGCSVDNDRPCDCIHRCRCTANRKRDTWWYVAVDSFTGIAVTYVPVMTEEPTRELITEPELARLLR